jgi:hypothetical protein
MSSLKISDLSFTGSELFEDSENFLNELDESDTTLVVGGLCQTIQFPREFPIPGCVSFAIDLTASFVRGPGFFPTAP